MLVVIPAQAGIQVLPKRHNSKLGMGLDSRIRGNDTPPESARRFVLSLLPTPSSLPVILPYETSRTLEKDDSADRAVAEN
jgi:hypothetical protein